MTCGLWEEAIALRAGGDLDADEAGRLEAHLSGCRACRALLEDLGKDRASLRELHGIEPPQQALEDLRRSVLSRIAREARTASETPRPRPNASPWRWFLAASALLVLGFTVLNRITIHPPEKSRDREAVMNRTAVIQPVPEDIVSPPPPLPEERPSEKKASPPVRGGRGRAHAGVPDARVAEGALDLLSQRKNHEPTVIRLQTGDPNIVITWLVENSGG